MFKAIIIVSMFVGAVVSGFVFVNTNDVDTRNLVASINPNTVNDDAEESWHKVAMWQPGLMPLGEATPSGGSGVLAVFLLDFGVADISMLGNNATDWSSSGDVHAYADADDFSEDTPSEDAFHIVVRCRFTKAVCFDAGDSQFVGNRTKCTITFSGDESGTITHYGNHTEDTTGGGICSYNDSGGDALFVNFYFTDADGFTISDDGSLSIDSIVVSAKY